MARYLLTITDEDAARLERWLGGVLIIGPAHLQTMGTACFVAGLDAITDDEYEVISRRLSTSGPLYHAGSSETRSDRAACRRGDHVFASGPPENQPPGTGELCLAGCKVTRYTWPDGTVGFTRGVGSPG